MSQVSKLLLCTANVRRAYLLFGNISAEVIMTRRTRYLKMLKPELTIAWRAVLTIARKVVMREDQ